MTVLALHGFLGQGSDWLALKQASELKDAEWFCPDLFSKDSLVQMTGFDAFVESFLESIKLQKVDLLLGYSFGGRMAIEILKRQPEFSKKTLLLSTHLGGMTSEQIKEKRERDSIWAMRFLSEDWEKLISDWNKQSLFSEDSKLSRDEYAFDRRKLYLSLENLSLSEQTMILDIPKSARDRIEYYYGQKDQKFASLYENYIKAEWLEKAQGLPYGHRLHLEAVKELSQRLRELENHSEID